MAGLQQRGGRYRIIFRNHGKQRTLPLGKISSREADAKSASPIPPPNSRWLTSLAVTSIRM
jgi:hypothetical protein